MSASLPPNVTPLRPPRADSTEIARRQGDETLVVDLDAFEGPLDLLLSLSRSQKVDLMQISVLRLAEQYLAFIAQARALRIELAADYLVMAAWLTFLKSRLLLPPDAEAEGQSADEMAAHLAFQLERLDAMRRVAAQLMGRDRLGMSRFARGAPQAVSTRRSIRHDCGLIDLLRAYARVRTRDDFRPYAFDRNDVYTMEQALDRIRSLIAFTGDWTSLAEFLPEGWDRHGRLRSATAATFAATLELARQGRLDLRQDSVFGPITVRRRGRGPAAG